MSIYDRIDKVSDVPGLKTLYQNVVVSAEALVQELSDDRAQLSILADKIRANQAKLDNVGGIVNVRSAFYRKLGELNKGSLE